MTHRDEQKEILKALEAYAEKYDADYYCVLLTPLEKGQRVRLYGSRNVKTMCKGELGWIIEGVVEKEVLFADRKRE